MRAIAGTCVALATWSTHDALHPSLPRDSDVEYWHLLGVRLPDLMLQTGSGSRSSLLVGSGHDHLVVFVAPRCPACSETYGAIRRVRQGSSISVVVTADFDDLDMVLSRLPTSARVYIDCDAEAADALGVIHIPTVLVIDGNGVIRRAVAGNVSVPDVIRAHAMRSGMTESEEDQTSMQPRWR